MKWEYVKHTKRYVLQDNNNETFESLFDLGHGYSATEELIDHKIKWKNEIIQDRSFKRKNLPTITKVGQSFPDIKRKYQKQKILDGSVK